MRRVSAMFLIAGLVCLCHLTAKAEEPALNLIRNPGFEEPGSPPPHWKRTTEEWPDFGTYDTKIKHGGAQSLKLIRPMDDNFTYWHQDDIKVQPDTDYVWGGWIRTEGVEGKLGAFLLLYGFPEGTNNHDDRTFNQNLATAKGTEDWKEYKTSLRIPAGTDHVTFFLEFSQCAGTAWFDDLYLRPASGDEVGLEPPWAREPGVATWQSFDEVVNGEFVGVSPRHVKGRFQGEGVEFTKDGKFGGALHLTLQRTKGYALLDSVGVGDYSTVELWVWREKQPERQGAGELVLRGSHWDWRIKEKDGKSCLALVRGGDWIDVARSKSEVPFNEWTHIAVTYEGKRKRSRIYINGQLDAENAEHEIESFGGPVRIGIESPGHRYVGKVDELGIFNRVKFAEEIRGDMSLSEPVFTADNGIISLCFEKPGPLFLSVHRDGRLAGRVGGAIAEFEKKGIGYKKTGVGSAYATRVKDIAVKKRDASECVVEATIERTCSEETKRNFEAVYRITLQAGRSWFESRLVGVKNTDTVKCELRGYYHLLQPRSEAAMPRSYDRIGGWVGASPAIGAIGVNPDDFTLGFRKTDGRPFGDITRPVTAPLNPGFTWTGNEPGILIFTAPTADETEFYQAGLDVLSDMKKAPPTGEIQYKQKGPDSDGKP